jgi:hypothetical protein
LLPSNKTLAFRIERAGLREKSAGLISPYGYVKLVSFLSHFPMTFTSGIGFECELKGPPKPADISFFIQPGDSLDILSRKHSQQCLPISIKTQREWLILLDFANGWNTHESNTKKVIQNLWLEFDYSTKNGYSLVPRFFLKISNDNVFNQPELLKIICAIFDKLKRKDCLEKCVSRILETKVRTKIFQLGSSIDTPDAPNRVCIKAFNTSDVPFLLKELGWGANSLLFDAIQKISHVLDRIEISLDVDNEGSILPRIGLECHVENPQGLPRNWHPFLNLLKSNGWISADKFESLKRFSGYTNDLYENGIWLSSIAKKHKILGYHRWIHHLKISFNSTDFISAKAYLGLNLRGLTNTSIGTLCNDQIKAIKDNKID